MAKIIYISGLLLFYMILSTLYTITLSLPVTSKPIENTPEHLAWEAWIMVPSSHDKVRKITPKSIFIVPNGDNNSGSGNNDNYKKDPTFMPQTQCPPGHTFDNFKCIPTVSIDQSQILITRLTNLVHSTDKYNGSNSDFGENYDYDYEYDTYETDESQKFENTGLIRNDNRNPSSLSLSSSSSSSDYNGEPLKINLSLEKFLPNEKNEKNDNNNEMNKSGSNIVVDNENIKNQPFRDQDIPSSASTKFKQTTSSQNKKSTADENNSSATTVTSLPNQRIIGSSTTVAPEKFDSSVSDKFSTLHTRTVTNNNTSSNFPILSPSETEMLSTASNTNSTKIRDPLDYDLDDSSTLRTSTSNDEMELVTTFDETTTTNLKDDLEKDSLITEQLNTNTATSGMDSETTETEEQISATTPLDQIDDDKTDVTMFEESPKLSETSNNADSKRTVTGNSNNTDSQIPQNVNANDTDPTTVDIRRDAAPLMETVESNNRFVYHHLNPTNSTKNEQMSQQKIETTTVSSDIREQLRIINQIVEENKKRAQQSSKIRFPDNNDGSQNSPNQYQNRYDSIRSDFVKFPTDTTLSSSRITSLPTRHKPSLNPLTYSSPYDSRPPQLIPSPSNSNIRIPNTSNLQQNSKPFWWLPTGWEVDRTGDRPMMVHFWSRIPVDPYTNSNGGIGGRNRLSTLPISTSAAGASTTSRYRENSKSPTENLYKQEIFTHQKQHHNRNHNHHHHHNQQQQQQSQQQQQDNIYSVLGAKQWKHNNR